MAHRSRTRSINSSRATSAQVRRATTGRVRRRRAARLPLAPSRELFMEGGSGRAQQDFRIDARRNPRVRIGMSFTGARSPSIVPDLSIPVPGRASPRRRPPRKRTRTMPRGLRGAGTSSGFSTGRETVRGGLGSDTVSPKRRRSRRSKTTGRYIR